MTIKGVAIVSGGMDSVTMAHLLMQGGNDLLVVSFDYGQRHIKELDYASWNATHLHLEHKIVDMRFMRDLLHGSSLTDDRVEVPDGHYSDESMKATVVPNRNMIMLSIAVGIAVAEKLAFVATAVHAGDHFIYPDCRPEFINTMNLATITATADGFGSWANNQPILAPFMRIGKHDIVKYGAEVGVPYEMTWSCYKGGDVHCGRCGTCVERKEAFFLAKVEDPTVYEDKEYMYAGTI
jgi:7-cyano-7-deazaguanine synthase